MHARLLNALSLLLAATTFASAVADDSVCILSNSEACAVEDVTPSSSDGSFLVYPGGDTRCAFDDYTDSVTTFSTNSTYFFQVFPNTALDKSKLMIFFQGGGACTDEDTCAFGLQCSLGASATFSTAASKGSGGVLDRSLESNVFKDWNVVFVPYCTGDIHIGNKVTAAYESGIEVLLGNSQCLGLDYAMNMNGYNNTMAVLDWALENYPDPDQIVVGGESAGALGAQVHSAHIAEMWDIEAKSTSFSVLADSYVGVVPEDHPAGELLDYYGTCSLDLGMPADIVTACESGTATTIEMVEALMEAVPTGKWLFIDSMGDETQRYFYALVDEGILGYPFSDLISAEDFYADMSEILDAYKSANDLVTTFIINSTQHVFLADSDFTEYESIDDELLGNALDAWLSSNASSSLTITPEPTAETPSTTTEAPSTTTETPSSAETSTPSSTTSSSEPLSC